MGKARKSSEQKANLYLLAIVAIVALVGIVVLVLNSDGVSVSEDLSGQAYVYSYSEVSGVKQGCKCGADTSGFCNPCPKK